MSEERLGFHPEMQEGNKGATQFTQAGSPSSFSIEDFARSLPDDSLREILSGIRPLKRKSQRTREIEKANNIPIEFLLFKLYWVDRKSGREAQQEIGVGTDTSYVTWTLKRIGIPRRDNSTARKVQFEDPRRKQELVAKTHTPESNRNKKESIKRWYREHPGEASKKGLAMGEGRRKNRGQQEQEALGTYPRFALFRLHYIEGYSVKEISLKTGLPEGRVRGFMGKYGVRNLDKSDKLPGKKKVIEAAPLLHILYKGKVELDPKEEYVIYRRHIEPEYDLPTLDEVGGQLGITHQWVRQIEKRAIKKLSSAATKSRVSVGQT